VLKWQEEGNLARLNQNKFDYILFLSTLSLSSLKRKFKIMLGVAVSWKVEQVSSLIQLLIWL
jgi:hypothetical protein